MATMSLANWTANVILPMFALTQLVAMALHMGGVCLLYTSLETQYYAWPQVFYDDGDRSFINVIDPDGNIDFYQYPWLSLGAYLVTGVDASNGDLFEGNGTVELLIVADVSA